MSDFKSLLSSFQNAVGTRTSESHKDAISTNDKEGLDKDDLSLNVQSMWRTTQIQRSIAHSHPHAHQNSEEPIHIAICACIVSSLPHESVWRSWMYNNDVKDNTNSEENCTASMHVHAKSPSTIPQNSWLKSKLIPVSHNPNWNDIRIVQAMLSLAHHALKVDKGNSENNPRQIIPTHILFVTESCIPITSMGELAKMIRKHGMKCSFMNAYSRDSPRCSRFDEHACFNVDIIPNEAVFKALPGWNLFSAHHIKQILKIPDQLGGFQLWKLFKRVWAPEEVYFPTALSLLGILPGSEIVEKPVMWAKWDQRLRGKDRAHPLVYEFSGQLIQNVVDEGFYFMRKFKQRIKAEEWSKLVLKQKEPSELRSYQSKSLALKRCRDYDETITNLDKKRSKE